jgi:hypothetical protein
MAPSRRAAAPRPQSMVPRKVIFSIDAIERRVSYVFAGLIGLLGLLVLGYVVFDFKKTTTLSESLSKTNSCAAPYLKVGKQCQEILVNTKGGYYTELALIGVCALGLFLFARRRNRPGVIFVLLFVGLSFTNISSVIGLLFIVIGCWVLWRGWCLYRYGVVGYKNVNEIKRERILARKEGRPDPRPAPVPVPATPTPSRRSSRAAKTTETPPARSLAEPSKRYTPKKQSRTRAR